MGIDAILDFFASVVLVTHAFFVIWVLIGGFIARRYKSAMIVQLLCVSWGIITTWFGIPCPLTLLEKALLESANAPIYKGECLPHYLWEPLSIPQGPGLAVSMLILLLVLNGIAYYPTIRKRVKQDT